MSLIFQSLQKLKSNLNPSSSGTDSSAIHQKQGGGMPYTWLRPILIGLVLVLALGCGAVYAVQYIKEQVEDNENNSAPQVQRRHLRPVHGALEPEPVDKPQVEEDQRQPQLQAVMAQSNQGRVQFYPPEKKAADDKMLPVAQVAAPSALLSTAPESVSTKPAALPETIGPLPAANSGERPPAPGQPITNVTMEAVERARRKALEKTARIGTLVHRIEQALAGAPDAGDPETLLGQLARIKGENHPYVMKLRAYWNFQRGAYPAAEADLKKVVAVHPDDLEAGINLALIEINAQRYAEALIRLKRLRHAYPDQAVVAELIKRLK